MISRTTRNYLLRRYGLGPVTTLVTWALAAAGRIVPALRRAPARPIFIVGCSRSGTTLFADVFGAHCDVCNVMDASQVWDLRYYDAEADDHRDEDDATDWEISRIRSSLGARLLLSGKARLVNKNNQNSVRLRYLKRIFPDAYVIHVVRDGRPVVLSNIARLAKDSYRRKFPFGRFPKPVAWRDYLGKPLVEQFAHQWQDITRLARDEGTALFGADRYTEVRFEDFCARPLAELDRIDRFCRLPPHGRPAETLEAIRPAGRETGSSDLPDPDMERIVRIAGAQLRQLGYLTEAPQ